MAGWVRLLGVLLALALGASAPRGQGEPQAERPSPIVRSVQVVGNQRYTAEQLAAAFGQREGEPLLSERELRRGVEVLFDTFHVRALVELVQPPAAGEEVDLRLTVEELPLDLELRITGNDEISDDKVREWAGLRDVEELYLYRAPRIRQRLLKAYRDEGFYFAEVKIVERPASVDPVTGEPVAPDVIFEIREGPEVKVSDVVLHGNDLLPDRGFLFLRRGLKKLAKIELRGPRLWGFFAKDFVPETLDADIVAMRQVYRDLGYLDAIVELERLEFSEDRSRVTIHIAIEEGEPYTVEAVEFQAMQREPDGQGGYREVPTELRFDPVELRELLVLEPGVVFEQRLVEEDHRALRLHYGEKGHVEHYSLPAWEGFHFLDPELVFDDENHRVKVTYRIIEGEPVEVREIRIRGNIHTQDRVLRRLMTIEPGQLADPAEVERSRARIESTDFFSPDVFHPDIIPPRVRYIDTGDPAVKDLEFLVEESGVLGFEVSGGISTTNGAFGAIRLRKGNFDVGNLPSSFGSTIPEIARLEAFHGAGQRLSIEAAPGTEVTRYTVSFFDPDVFHMHEDYIGLGLNAFSQRRRYESHLEERRDYSVRLQRQLTADSSAWVRYGFGSVEVDDIFTGREPNLSQPLAVPEDLKDQEGKNRLGRIEVGWRYQTVDSRIQPRNGTDVFFQASVYDELLGSDFEFTRGLINIDFYDEFDEDPDIVSDYVHLGFELVGGSAYGNTDEVPYTERTFYGGRQLRGFDFRGIGPNENDFPIGGVTAFYGTFEYRRPLVKNIQPGSYREIEAIQAGVFLDFGLQDPDEFSLDFDELRVSTGILFGISFPVPLTFSFGFPLREGDGDDTQVFEFEIGF